MASSSVVRIIVLMYADVLAGSALFMMMTYLTNVWKLDFTHAAAIVNVFYGVATIMPIGMAFFVDAFMGDYWMLLLSSLAYSFGLSFLAMSTPHVLPDAARNCDAHKPDCIGDAQKVLFYTALVLIAIGISGHITSLESFLVENQRSAQENSENPMLRRGTVYLFTFLLLIVGYIALPSIKPWFVRFGIPAICTVVATFIFTTRTCSYRCSRPPGSPLTTLCRVFVASASKTFRHLPPNDHIQEPYTQGLRFLDKAAVEVQTQNQEQIEQSRWKLCTREEVEDTKMVIRMIPMWTTFIMFAVVISMRKTYFLDQANHMNLELGKLNVPLLIFKFISDLDLFNEYVREQVHKPYVKLAENLNIPKRYVPRIGIFVAMLFSILCCITAAGMETRRLDMIRRHLLLDKPNDSNEKIPMSVFWLIPQFLLLGAAEGMANFSIGQFFTNQAPALWRRYLKHFISGFIGAGTVGSVLSVYVVGKFSERGGRINWFQDTLNKSRLDNYYWTLTVLSCINLFLYILVASQYTYRDPRDEDADETSKNEEPTQP